MDPEGSIKLISAILAGVRRLPGASCVGRHELYDELHGGYGRRHRDQERERHDLAAACCAGCPARTRCTTVTTSSTVTLAVSMRRTS
ncbi:MAG: hypothetical protein M3Y48_23455 [Actinomycetota bacterium]|nr:hypothetical protein [Actinomycetota bacterium]